jgi:hypothetical protein
LVKSRHSLRLEGAKLMTNGQTAEVIDTAKSDLKYLKELL